MKEQIRVAVVGLGRLGFWHAENLASKVRGAHLACVSDSKAQLAEKTARDFGVPLWSSNTEAVMEDPDIDAIVIATPTSTHAELIKKAAVCGKHVFVEKPLTLNLTEADDVIQTVDKHGVFCQVGFMRRFDPAFSEAAKRIAAGDIGKPLYFKSVSRDPKAPPAEFIKHSGGIFLDMAIHDFDLARYLMGTDIRSVAGHGTVLVHPYVEQAGDLDQALAFLKFHSGAAGDVEVSRNALYGYDIRGEVVGAEGTIVIGSLKYHDIQILSPKGSVHDIVPNFPERFNDAYLLEMIHFIDSLRREERPAVTEIDGKIALEISIAAQRSFDTGIEVLL